MPDPAQVHYYPPRTDRRQQPPAPDGFTTDRAAVTCPVCLEHLARVSADA